MNYFIPKKKKNEQEFGYRKSLYIEKWKKNHGLYIVFLPRHFLFNF
jgi:hypothetical protein